MILDVFEEVLTNLDGEGVEELGDNWFGFVRARLTDLEDSYRILTQQNRDPIDYSDQATQAAYVFAYGMPRAGFTYERLKQHRDDLGRPLFRQREIKVASVGGGPASELIGLLEYLQDPAMGENVSSIEYTIYDHNENWEDVANLTADCATGDIDISVIFERLDLLSTEQVDGVSLARYDLTIFSYIISELKSFVASHPVVANIKSLLSSVSERSFVFYMDSESYQFYSVFNNCRFVPGLVQRRDLGGNTAFYPGEYDGVFAEYIEVLDREPRLDGNIVSKLLEKT